MRSSESALRPPPFPLYRQQVVSLSQSSCVPPVELTDEREGEGVSEEPYYTTTRKPGPLWIIQNSLASTQCECESARGVGHVVFVLLNSKGAWLIRMWCAQSKLYPLCRTCTITLPLHHTPFQLSSAMHIQSHIMVILNIPKTIQLFLFGHK